MIKKIFTLCFCLLSFASFTTAANAAIPANTVTLNKTHSSCGQVSIDNPQFCSIFKEKSACYCNEHGGLGDACNDPDILYDALLNLFDNIDSACTFQSDTDKDTCLADWTFYRNNCR